MALANSELAMWDGLAIHLRESALAWEAGNSSGQPTRSNDLVPTHAPSTVWDPWPPSPQPPAPPTTGRSYRKLQFLLHHRRTSFHGGRWSSLTYQRR
jgi:hypothetical protein